MVLIVRTVIDLHCDSVCFLSKGIDLRSANPGGHIDLPRLRKGGVGVQAFAAFVSPSTPEDGAFAAACAMLADIDGFARSDPGLSPVETANDCTNAIVCGKTGILKAVENGWAIENSLDKLAELRRQNVRILTLVHSEHTAWAASCTGTGSFIGGGLSPFGLRVVDAMNDLGIIVDVSHSAESAFWDAVHRSKKPVIASHSCVHAFCASPRNLKDDQIRAIGDSGGLIGVCFFPGFLSEAFRLAMEGDHTGPGDEKTPDIPLSIAGDHIDYIIKLAGEDCVGLGSDFDGVTTLPAGVGGCDCYPLLEAELKRRGYSEDRLDKLFNRNFLRVLKEYDS
jgi:membrane dipeptidase